MGFGQGGFGGGVSLGGPSRGTGKKGGGARTFCHPGLALGGATRRAMGAGPGRVLTLLPTRSFLAQVRASGERLRSALEQMIPTHEHLFDGVRGMGLMLGIKLKSDSRAFVGFLRTRGILTVAAADNVVRVLPPLNIEERHIREFIDGLSAAAAAYEVPAAA